MKIYKDKFKCWNSILQPKECLICDPTSHTCMKDDIQYTHLLRSLDCQGNVKYQLPAILVDVRSDYTIYSRPYPVIHHHVKQESFTLDFPEILLVSKTGHHCISIAFDENEAVNMYVNINMPPVAHKTGHEWRDLELDIKLSREPDGKWKAVVVDQEEFNTADLSHEQEKIALDEVEDLLARIQNQSFPFSKSLNEIKKLVR